MLKIWADILMDLCGFPNQHIHSKKPRPYTLLCLMFDQQNVTWGYCRRHGKIEKDLWTAPWDLLDMLLANPLHTYRGLFCPQTTTCLVTKPLDFLDKRDLTSKSRFFATNCVKCHSIDNTSRHCSGPPIGRFPPISRVFFTPPPEISTNQCSKCHKWTNMYWGRGFRTGQYKAK